MIIKYQESWGLYNHTSPLKIAEQDLSLQTTVSVAP